MFSTKLLFQTSTRKLVYQPPKAPRIAPGTHFFSTKMAKGMAQEYKLKGLSKLDLKPGEKREVEVEGVEEGKVLLLNVNGKHSALGSKCTHYGTLMLYRTSLGPQANIRNRSSAYQGCFNWRRKNHLSMARR